MKISAFYRLNCHLQIIYKPCSVLLIILGTFWSTNRKQMHQSCVDKVTVQKVNIFEQVFYEPLLRELYQLYLVP